MPLTASSPSRTSSSSPPAYDSSRRVSGRALTFCTKRLERAAASGAQSVTLSQTDSTYFVKSISSSTMSVTSPICLASGADTFSAVHSTRFA
eukprot:CAMPEP_0170435316 /NCGR_PEP_ID=MMETSP0117_2-20130122/43535_1 /TAXON_ID=400756 /ORGANISM="Durinskia baltica, Strain CSIRO CS-38" /LENGTH=91 /DNA_ID=CAMNT_0010695261 /DNA_START=67 /DNA_END=342 /DNA_ORIENTATION=+